MKQLSALLVLASLSFVVPAFAQPANDNFAARFVLSGTLVITNGTTVSATRQVGEPSPFQNMGPSVWYEWTAPSSGAVNLSIAGSFREVLGVYTGTGFPLNQIALASPGFTGTSAALSFNAVAGTPYKILVSGRNGASGTFTINLAVPTVIFPFGSVWKYLDDGSDQGIAWRTNTFDDSSWAAGPGELGYGDENDGRPEATVVGYGPDPNNRYVTTYFRRTFNLSNPGTLTAMIARYIRDDGIVLYVNGVEVSRSSMPGGTVNYQTLGFTADDDGTQIVSSSVPLNLLRTGVNVIAAEIHQSGIQSTDISFDLELSSVGGGNSLPAVAITSPADGATFRPGTNITVTISASDSDGSVTNVALFADLTKLAEFSAPPYTFAWNNVPQGNYVLTAVATDDAGGTRTSAAVNISVNTFTIEPVTLIASNSVWRYLDNGSDQGTAWREISFNDNGWPSGAAELGYGDAGEGRPETTVIGAGPASDGNQYTNYYFRRFFTVTNAAFVSNLVLRMVRDDGAVVYINGSEVRRDNLPGGTITSMTLSPTAVAGADEAVFFATTNSAILNNGTNVIAVEVHQQSGTSTDVSFNLELVANTIIGAQITNTIAPFLQTKVPGAGATVFSLTSVQVSFSEAVDNVNASDLLINGSPATGLSGGGNSYTFTFPQPAFGTVNISWAPGHGIVDQGTPVLPFDHTAPGASWSYTLVDNVAPTIVLRSPPAGFTLTNLTTITVGFSENVAGVNASDLLINGSPAVGLTIESPSIYTFSFSQPALGPVFISWAAGHGIADTSPSANAFNANGAGATWSYTLENKVTLVAADATWNYFKGVSEPSNPTDQWRFVPFNDSTWLTGMAPFYYGAYAGNTLLTDMLNTYSTLYLRHAFLVNNPNALTNLILRWRCDDGFVLWINGVEKYRTPSVGGGSNSFLPFTATVNNNAALGNYTSIPIGLENLVSGTNVVAVQLLNTTLNSSDILLDLDLSADVLDPALIPPTVAAVTPPAGEVFTLNTITVTFSEPVQNVNASDLLINGVAATGLSGSGSVWTFTFAPPAFGVVNVTWAAAHGITDFDSPPRGFLATAPGATFSYAFVNPSAPTIASQVPLASSVVSSLSQVQVIFSKAVQGVNASDLLVNGSPATNVSGSGATYTFAFRQPAYGNVAVSWAIGHNIRDTEPAQNPFDAGRPGATWQYNFIDLQPPTIAGQNPPAGANVTNLQVMTVRFSESVQGVNASDLLINGVPALNFGGSGSNYTFVFTRPNTSIVNVEWAPNHGIADLASPANLFNATGPGATWQYFTPDNVPPAVTSVSPAPGSTVRSLSQIVVQFGEPVTGVDAGDLRINSVPAQSVSGSAAGPYTFQFTQPVTGIVEVLWSIDHEITDLANPPNPFAGGEWIYTLNPNAAFADKLVINEIFFHPSTERPSEEWIELHNVDTTPINLSGWRITKGVDFTFPNVSVPAGGYLVVAANVAAFQAKYPGVNNVVGGWVGQLSNTGEDIEIETAFGEEVDVVEYADEGDWAIRQRGPLDGGYRGWEWFSAADGTNLNTGNNLLEGGRSLELRNAALPNEFGQNWAPSTQTNGTPGVANTVRSTNIPPMVLEVAHFPVIPRSSDTVSITARIRDEQPASGDVTLFYRNHSTTTPPAFSSLAMFDDGAHSDGLPGDGLFGVSLPAQANGTVIEYYVRAVDPQLNVNTWPAAARQTDGSFAQTANALYQVADEVYTGSQAIYRLILTETERAEFAGINRQSDAEMNCTFVSVDGEGTKVHQNCGMRIRGAGSRGANPPNLRVNIPSDRRWNDLTEINLNTRFTHAQTLGSALSLKAGLPASYARPVKVRVNGTDMANSGSPMFGSYVLVEPINGEWASKHYPNDDGGNVYRGSRAPWTANLDHRGTNYTVYEANGYSKTSNQSENDWTDLFNLTFALNTNANDAVYEQAVLAHANVTNFMRFFAVGALMSYQETSLLRGVGDDYAMYRGVLDPRFTLVPHDFDTILNQGDTGGNVTESVFQVILNPESNNSNERANFLQRMMRHPNFVPIYFAELKRLAETVFAPANLNPLADQLLGEWASGTLNSIKTFNANRSANVLSQIPMSYTLVHTLAASNGTLRSVSGTINLRGTANAIDTRGIRVNGVNGSYSAWEGRWTNNAINLQPGLNNLLIEAVGAAGQVVWNTNLVVWHDTGAFTSVGGGINADSIWSAGTGPYRVTANVTVANGVTLTIQPGTTVYLNPGVGITVADGGRLVAEGNVNARIQFNIVPGPSNRWSGIVINGSGTSPESRIRYAHIAGNNGTAIDVNGGDAFLSNLTFGTTDRRYLDLDGASFVVQDCVFPATTAAIEPVHGTAGIRSGGRGLFLRNYFGRVQGYNDNVDFTGGNRPGPIVQFINNVFVGSDDDLLDLDSTDAWIEGNIFIGVHRLGSPDSASAISGGNDNGQTSEITILGNIFYDVDHVATAKQGNFYTLINNTVVRQSSAGFEDAGVGAVVNFADEGTAPGAGIYLEGNIFANIERLTRHLTNGSPAHANTTFNNNLMPLAYSGPGTNNSAADPLLVYIPQVAEAQFMSWSDAQVMRDWFSLQAGSPGIATGPNGRDKGGVVPLGVSLTGEPAGVSPLNSVTLRVGVNRTGNGIPGAGFPAGSGYTHYRWRLDGGPWSAETPALTPIVLNNLPFGAHQVEAVGRRDAGYYQDDPIYGADAIVSASRTWIVNTNASVVRINEILASNNGGFVHSNTTPDALELVNLSPNPINLAGMRLTDDPTNPDLFTFGVGAVIPAGGYLVVFGDIASTPGIHLGFTFSAEGETLYLYDSVARGGALLDSVTFGLQVQNLSVGRMPDGTWTLTQPTMGAANVPAPIGDVTRLRINEWLASGLSLSPDDFIEIFNQDPRPVALGGLFLTDEPNGWPDQHEITPLSFIAGGGYRSFVADEDVENGADHLNFRLTPEQGTIGLMNRDLSVIDFVVYGAQNVDISEGRAPNGGSNIVYFPQPTPGAPNQSVINTNSGVVINEVFASNSSYPEADGTTPDWVEFRNLSGTAVDVGDMSVTDSTLQPRRFVFAPGTTIPALGYLRLRFDPDLPVSPTNTGFGLRASGGAVFLFDKLASGGGLLNSVTYGLQAVDFSIGRVPNGTGAFVLTVPTPDAANNSATLGNASLLKINEWMASPLSGEDDWFEIYNPNIQPVAVGGLYLSDSLANRTKSPIPALSFIGGGTNGWQRFWADSNPASGADHTSFALGAGGEALAISTSASTSIDSITFGSQQTDVSEGRFPDGSATIVRFPQTQSPGEANYLLLTNVVINEALTHSDPPFEDAIELRNMTAAPLNIGNWWLSDSRNVLRKYRIPANTTIPANGYIVFYEHQFNADTNDPSSFSLSSDNGDEVYLSAADANGNLTGYRAEVDFDAAPNGVSFGRYVTSDNRAEFVSMSARSFGQDDPASLAVFRTGTGLANPYPRVGPVVIAQIMYRPPEVGTNDNTVDEFIELRNTSAQPVPLYDAAFPTNTWRLRDGLDFDFPQGVTLPAGGRLLVVSFDPANNPAQLSLFRAKYGLDVTTPVYGPYIGRLANGDDDIELHRPDVPGANNVPYVLVERVHYFDEAPWSPGADGTGAALQRLSLSGFANDPTNWVAVLPNFGGGSDTDGDGIPDAWESQYGLNPANAADAGQDGDGDGLTNLEEYLAGTSPINADSALRIISIEDLGANSARLSFFAVSNKSYTVEYKNALTDPSWLPLTTVSSAPSNRVMQVNTALPGTRFFRLRVP